MPETDDCVVCKFCGESGFHWEERDGKWGLYDTQGFRHHCQTIESGHSRVDIYEAVDSMSPHELRELIGYAEQKLQKDTEPR